MKKLSICSGALIGALGALATQAMASDHLDSPSVIADPRADIGDIYAWMSPDAERLNLVMTIVGHSFSSGISYAFHIDSARAVGERGTSTDLVCTFAGADFTCQAGGISAAGKIGDEQGASSSDGRLKAFAGLRDDPFFNNVRGTRDMYNAVSSALSNGATYDAGGCPRLSPAVALDVRKRWQRTDGGPGTNFLKGWTSASIVLSVDKRLLVKSGPLLAAWAVTRDGKGHIDRMARPLTGNALLATLGSDAESDALKEKYNRASPSGGKPFVAEIAKGVALYDGLDGHCGDSLLIEKGRTAPERYYPLARLLADDRLWIDSRYGRCAALFAVERAALNHERNLSRDCGGRGLTYDAVNVYRSLLAEGRPTGISDGVHRDEVRTSDTVFPFLAPAGVPAKAGY